jgi:predicted ATPase
MPLPAGVHQEIVAKAAGNPFFLEELAWTIREHGTPQTPLALPATVQAVLASRLDRLPPAEKSLMQTAAVIGTEVPLPLLHAVSGLAEDVLQQYLRRLQTDELVYERRLVPVPVYAFKHILTQEVAYNSLLSTRRIRFHTAIGLAMEALYQERLAERYEDLAHHFSHGEAWEKAFIYLGKAGDKARQAYANQEAIVFYTRALEWFHSELGNASRAVELDHESLELGRRYRVANVEISALINLGIDYLALGQYERARSYLQSTLDRVEREAFGPHKWRWKVKLLIRLAELYAASGASEQALRTVAEGLEQARTTSSQKYVAIGWTVRGKVAAKLGDSNTAGTVLRRAFALAEQLHSPALLYPIAYDLGQWYETTGREQEAVALYGTAKATVEHMAAAIEDEVLCAAFRQSALVQALTERAARLGI